jgi:hypothetical protein
MHCHKTSPLKRKGEQDMKKKKKKKIGLYPRRLKERVTDRHPLL